MKFAVSSRLSEGVCACVAAVSKNILVLTWPLCDLFLGFSFFQCFKSSFQLPVPSNTQNQSFHFLEKKKENQTTFIRNSKYFSSFMEMIRKQMLFSNILSSPLWSSNSLKLFYSFTKTLFLGWPLTDTYNCSFSLSSHLENLTKWLCWLLIMPLHYWFSSSAADFSLHFLDSVPLTPTARHVVVHAPALLAGQFFFRNLTCLFSCTFLLHVYETEIHSCKSALPPGLESSVSSCLKWNPWSPPFC